ncbi:MAG: NAD(P)H-hydrate dehydratase [Planctomycetes bacterium]|nr:NAD(P)H-hydrate dehydratase [Planctomycetota bacterium]
MPVSMVLTLPKLPSRPDDSHKGSFGNALIVAGSRGMSGAAVLAGLGALRGGAGLTTLAIPVGVQSIVAGYEPSYLTVGLPEDASGRIALAASTEIFERAQQATAVAIGPGWGKSGELVELARVLYTQLDKPLIVDADALNALASLPEGLPATPPAPRILTPHPGEFSRLTGRDTAEIQADRESLAAAFASEHNLVVVLKGQGTVITDGQQAAINTTGNSGMATGGTGDVLTGLVVALLAQGVTPFDAAHLSVHVHGLAGDLAATELGKPGMTASDLPTYLGRAWRHLGSG